VFAQANRSEFRLFLSSTFRDLQAEREYLVKHVFPRVRAACRERGREFTAIDLRWGVTDEDASLGRIIRTCLEEVER
jgi:nephrocystin-3